MSLARRVSLQPAYVLHRRDYRETSLLLEVLTRDHGRIGLLARGARRSRRGRAASLQPFRPLLVSWSGRGELPIVTDVDSAGQPLLIPPDRMPHAFYLSELLMILLAREDAQPLLFAAYGEALASLVAHPETALRRFEVTLLECVGTLPDITRDAVTRHSLEPAARYRFEPDRGPVPADDDHDSPWIVSGTTLLALDSGRFEQEETRREARRFMQTLLAHVLGGRPLRSRELFRRTRR